MTTKLDRSYLSSAFTDFARTVNEKWPPAKPGHLDGLEPAPTARSWIEGHPRARRWSLVKFLDGQNHGMGLDVWEGKGCALRGWAHGKGSMMIEWTIDPRPMEISDAIGMVARFTGFEGE